MACQQVPDLVGAKARLADVVPGTSDAVDGSLPPLKLIKYGAHVPSLPTNVVLVPFRSSAHDDPADGGMTGYGFPENCWSHTRPPDWSRH